MNRQILTLNFKTTGRAIYKPKSNLLRQINQIMDLTALLIAVFACALCLVLLIILIIFYVKNKRTMPSSSSTQNLTERGGNLGSQSDVSSHRTESSTKNSGSSTTDFGKGLSTQFAAIQKSSGNAHVLPMPSDPSKSKDSTNLSSNSGSISISKGTATQIASNISGGSTSMSGDSGNGNRTKPEGTDSHISSFFARQFPSSSYYQRGSLSHNYSAQNSPVPDESRRQSFLDHLRRRSTLTPHSPLKTHMSVNSSSSSATWVTMGQALSLPGFLLLIPDVDFHLESLLTEGGGGMIFLGELNNIQVINRNGDRQSCVIKAIRDSRMSKEDLKNTFLQEVAVTWMFSSSKNFVKLLGYAPEQNFIILRNYERGSLKTRIHQTGNDDWNGKLIAKVACDISTAIAEMHHTGIVHNDIKSANVLLDFDENGLYAVLCDFGVATVIDESLFRVKAMPKSDINGASAAYAAPEVFIRLQALMSKGNIRTETDMSDLLKAVDVYALGIILFEMLSRTFPWAGCTYAEIEKAVLQGKRPTIPPEIISQIATDKTYGALNSIMERCWAQNPLDRPPAKRLVPDLYKLKREKTGGSLTQMKKTKSREFESVTQ